MNKRKNSQNMKRQRFRKFTKFLLIKQLTKLSVFLREKFPILVNVYCICFSQTWQHLQLLFTNICREHLQVRREQTCHLHHSDTKTRSILPVVSSSSSSSSSVPQCAPPLHTCTCRAVHLWSTSQVQSELKMIFSK